MNDFRRWQKLKYLPLEAAEILARYPVLADRALHEIERLWVDKFIQLPLKKQLAAYQASPWYAALPVMQKNIATTIATAYCTEMREAA